VGLVAALPEEGGGVPLVGAKLPAEGAVREAHDAVRVRVAPCGEGGAAGAALRGDAKGVFEPDPGRSERVQVGGAHGFDPITAQVTAQVVAGDQNDVRSLQ